LASAITFLARSVKRSNIANPEFYPMKSLIQLIPLPHKNRIAYSTANGQRILPFSTPALYHVQSVCQTRIHSRVFHWTGISLSYMSRTGLMFISGRTFLVHEAGFSGRIGPDSSRRRRSQAGGICDRQAVSGRILFSTGFQRLRSPWPYALCPQFDQPGPASQPSLFSSSSFLRYWFSRRVASRSKT
jgi:hypothetical protein